MMKTKVSLLAVAALLGAGSLAFAQEGNPDKPDRRRPFPPEVVKEFDKDGDGKLSDEEAKAAREAREKKMLEKYDADKDGKLSDEERKAAREAMRAEREKKLLEKYDKDGDGKLSDEEKKAAAEAGDGPRRGGRRVEGDARPDGQPPVGPPPGGPGPR